MGAYPYVGLRLWATVLILPNCLTMNRFKNFKEFFLFVIFFVRLFSGKKFEFVDNYIIIYFSSQKNLNLLIKKVKGQKLIKI